MQHILYYNFCFNTNYFAIQKFQNTSIKRHQSRFGLYCYSLKIFCDGNKKINGLLDRQMRGRIIVCSIQSLSTSILPIKVFTSYYHLPKLRQMKEREKEVIRIRNVNQCSQRYTLHHSHNHLLIYLRADRSDSKYAFKLGRDFIH